jgi:hypothetical protein
MRLHFAERLGGLPFAVTCDLFHRQPGVVIEDGPRHAGKVREGTGVTAATFRNGFFRTADIGYQNIGAGLIACWARRR